MCVAKLVMLQCKSYYQFTNNSRLILSGRWMLTLFLFSIFLVYNRVVANFTIVVITIIIIIITIPIRLDAGR